MIRPIWVIQWGMIISVILVHLNGGLPVKLVFASEPSIIILQDVRNHPVKEKTQNNSKELQNETLSPDLPPPVIDPDIVHKPSTTPNPAAVIPPPKIDPEMAIKPQSLPGYPDFPQGQPKEIVPDRIPKNKKGQPN